MHRSNPEVMDGVVFFEEFAIPCFELETAIEPSNCFAIPHADLEKYSKAGKLELMDVLVSIHDDMQRAINKCRRIDPKRKAKLLEIINNSPV